MPKALLLSRPSGVYARFLVPQDLRDSLGSRFLVRALHLPLGDAARQAAARLAMALSSIFKVMRAGASVDRKELDELLRKAASGELSELTLQGVTLPGGARVERAQIDTPQDARMFADILRSRPAPAKDDGDWMKASRARKRAEEEAKRQQGPSLSEAIDKHIADLTRAKRDPKTLIESRHSLRILLGVVGDVAASQLTVEHVREFLDAVQHWPKNATKRAEYRDLTVRQIVTLSKSNGEPSPKAWTLNKHWDRLAVFVRHLHASGVLDRDPMAGLARLTAHSVDVEADSGRPFSHAELQIVFGPAFSSWSAKWPHRHWGVVLGLYSGARVNEVAQLRVVDVCAIEGVWGFVVTPKVEGNKVKNTNSKRFVPLAQPVLDAGFLDYVEEVRAAGHVRLFPNLPNSTGLGMGRQLSRQFSSYIKKQGIAEPGMGFHAFRHYLITHLDRALSAAGMKPEQRDPVIGRITGHYKPPATTLRAVYVDKDGLPVPPFSEPETLPERVATLRLLMPPVSLPAHVPGRFADQLKRAASVAKRVARQVPKKSKAPA